MYKLYMEFDNPTVEMFGKRVIALDEGIVVSDGMEDENYEA